MSEGCNFHAVEDMSQLENQKVAASKKSHWKARNWSTGLYRGAFEHKKTNSLTDHHPLQTEAEAPTLISNLSQGDSALRSNHCTPGAAVIHPLLTTATRHRRNEVISKMTALIHHRKSRNHAPCISPVDQVGAKTSRSIPAQLL